MKDFMLRAAVRKLHDWVAEQKALLYKRSLACTDLTIKSYYGVCADEHGFMETKMRTLFAGLIDFDEE